MTKDCIILNKKKKILIVTPDFQLGGTNTSLENLLNQISIDNYDYLVDILALSSFGYLKPRFIYYNVIKTNKILNFWFSSFREFRGLNKIIAIIIRLIRKICDFINFDFEKLILKIAAKSKRLKGYDIVVGYQEGAPTRFVANLSAKKRIAWVHCNLLYSNYNFDSFKLSYRRIDEIICVSQSAKQTFDKLYPDCEIKSKVIYNIIEPKKVKALAAKKEIGLFKYSSNNKFVSIGRLDPVKQFHLIPSIAAKIKENRDDFVWFIVGSGREEKKILEEIKKYGVENNVIMMGFKDNPYSILSDCDLYICTSESEACPMVFLEANALGKFVISNDFPSAHEILSHEIGSICSISDMADKILNYISLKKSTVPFEKERYKDYKTNIETLLKIQ